MQGAPAIYVVSDSIGETGELLARAAAAQFDGVQFEIRLRANCGDEEAVRAAVAEAASSGGLILYTMVVPEMRDLLSALAVESGVPAIDVMGPVVSALQRLTNRQPRNQPGLVHRLDEDYFRRVEAVEFAVKYDDGKDPRGVFRADVVLIGVSRTSKTPVSLYLAQRRYKVANIPLVPEVPPPAELFQIPAAKIVGLTVSPLQLAQIREERVRLIGLRGDANYASLQRILQELEYADGMFRRLGCPVVDATNKAVEETALRVIEIVRRGGQRHGG